MNKDYVAKAKHLAQKIQDDKQKMREDSIKDTKKFVAATTKMRDKVKAALMPFDNLPLNSGKLHIVSDEILNIQLIQRKPNEKDIELLSLGIYPNEIVFAYPAHWNYNTYRSINELLDFIAKFVSKRL